MLPGGPCTQSDEDLMTIRSADGAEGPNAAPAPPTFANARKKIKQKKHRTKFRVQFLPLAGAALTVI